MRFSGDRNEASFGHYSRVSRSQSLSDPLGNVARGKNPLSEITKFRRGQSSFGFSRMQRIRTYFRSSRIIVNVGIALGPLSNSTWDSHCRAITVQQSKVSAPGRSALERDPYRSTYLIDLVDEPGEFLGLHDDNSAFPGFTRCSYFSVLARPDPTRPSRFPVLDRAR